MIYILKSKAVVLMAALVLCIVLLGCSGDPPTAPAGGSGAGGGGANVELIKDKYASIEDAIGLTPPNEGTVIDTRPTRSPGLIGQGFTEMVRVQEPNDGTIHTVFRNPTTGEYAGGHESSEQDD